MIPSYSLMLDYVPRLHLTFRCNVWIPYLLFSFFQDLLCRFCSLSNLYLHLNYAKEWTNDLVSFRRYWQNFWRAVCLYCSFDYDLILWMESSYLLKYLNIIKCSACTNCWTRVQQTLKSQLFTTRNVKFISPSLSIDRFTFVQHTLHAQLIVMFLVIGSYINLLTEILI